MPTIAELITATEAKLARAEDRLVALRQQLAEGQLEFSLTDQRRQHLRTRLEALKVLGTEGP